MSHDECIIDRKTVYLVNSKGFHLLVSSLESRKMGGGASRGESSRKGENNSLLSLKVVLTCNILPVERILVLGLNAGAGPEGYIGDGSSFLDGGGVFLEGRSGKRGHSTGDTWSVGRCECSSRTKETCSKNERKLHGGRYCVGSLEKDPKM